MALLTANVKRRASRRAARVGQRLRDRRLLPGIDVPAERVASIEGWSGEHPEGVDVRFLGSEDPPASRPARTLGAEQEIFKGGGRREPRPMWVLSIRNGRLATDAGLAIAGDGRVVAETTWDREQLDLAAPPGLRLPRPARLSGTHASLITLWSENYFHWMLDALPRYAVLERAGLTAEPRLIVPEHLTPFQAESLDLLGIPAARRVPFRRRHVTADMLVVASPAAHTGNPVPWVVRWLRERLAPAVESRQRRLYVSRAGARTRRVANEDALWRLLRRRGFQRVAPERLTLTEQIRLFAEAAVVVAPHGAAQTNTLFSRSLTLVELFSSDYLNPCNFALSEAAGNEYWYVVGTPSQDGAFDVPIEVVGATLDAVET